MEIKEFLKKNILSVILWGIIGLSLILFIIFKNLLFGGAVLFSMGLENLVLGRGRKNFLTSLSGVSLLLFGLAVVILKYDLKLSLTVLITILLISFIVITKIKKINSPFSNFIAIPLVLSNLVIAFFLIPPLIKDILNYIFSTEYIVKYWIFYGIVFLYIFLAIYQVFSVGLSVLKEKKIIQKKFDNLYFSLSLTLILLILIIGLIETRTLYINDLPFNIPMESGKNNLSTIIFECRSEEYIDYLLDYDSIICEIKNPEVKSLDVWFEEGQVKKIKFENISKGPQNYQDYHFIIDNGSIDYFWFIVNKNDKEYFIDLLGYRKSNDSSRVVYQEKWVPKKILSREEYEKRILTRIGLLVSIISIALFSVFSAMANLKKIIEDS